MRRREFVGLLGGAALAWPLATRAQQPAVPVIGFLNPASADASADRLRSFHRGLKDAGYVEGQNLAIEYRWAEGQNDRLPELAAELVRRQVAVVAAIGPRVLPSRPRRRPQRSPSSSSSPTIRSGMVSSPASRGRAAISRASTFSSRVGGKAAGAAARTGARSGRIAVLVNPTNARDRAHVQDVEAAARAMGLQIQVLKASTNREIDAAFASFARERPDALFVAAMVFTTRRVQLAQLAAHHAIPATYGSREFAEAGGLMSYGPSLRMLIARSAFMPDAFSRAPSPRTCQSCSRPSSSWSSTSRPPGCSASPCRRSVLARADEVIE